jgi:hypothetical protein
MMDIMAEYDSGPYMSGKRTLLAPETLFHRILRDRFWDQSSFELARPESANRRCKTEILHIFDADAQPEQLYWTGKERDRITSFWKLLGERRPCFESFKTRNIGAQFATENIRWRMPSGAPIAVCRLGFSVWVKFSDQGKKAELGRNEIVFLFNFGMALARSASSSRRTVFAELVRSHFAMRRWDAYSTVSAQSIQTSPYTDPSINNSDKTNRGKDFVSERVFKAFKDSFQEGYPLNSKSSHRRACRSTGPTPHHLHIQHHDTEMKPSKQY